MTRRKASRLSWRSALLAGQDNDHFFLFSWHFSGYDRKRHDAGRCNYMPLNLGEVPDYYRRFLAPVDIAILKTCPMDENGYFNFSAANLCTARLSKAQRWSSSR
jgi:acyl-CoA hydrolase